MNQFEDKKFYDYWFESGHISGSSRDMKEMRFKVNLIDSVRIPICAGGALLFEVYETPYRRYMVHTETYLPSGNRSASVAFYRTLESALSDVPSDLADKVREIVLQNQPA